MLDEEAVAEQTATLLSEKTVVGWFQGSAEYGPRALGNRSILADWTSRCGWPGRSRIRWAG